MVHETKLLTFWRSLNAELRAQQAEPINLDTASPLFEAGFTVSEAVQVLAPSIWPSRKQRLGLTDVFTDLPYGYDAREAFGERTL